MSGNTNNIKVVCRFRPMNRMEVDAKSEKCVDITDDALTVRMKNAVSLAGPEKDVCLWTHGVATAPPIVGGMDFCLHDWCSTAPM